MNKPSKQQSHIKKIKKIIKQNFNGYNHKELADKLNVRVGYIHQYVFKMGISRRKVKYVSPKEKYIKEYFNKYNRKEISDHLSVPLQQVYYYTKKI